jgi:hypothetical protein
LRFNGSLPADVDVVHPARLFGGLLRPLALRRTERRRKVENDAVKPTFCLALLSLVPALAAAQQPAPAAPIPAPIVSAHTIFLANGGDDLVSADTLTRAGQPASDPYNSVYAALKTWGHWQLLSSPEGADLILVVRFSAPVYDYANGMPLSTSPQFEVTILDGKSGILLWTVLQPVAGAARKSTWAKNYAGGIDGAVQQLKAIAGGTAPPATPQP